MSEEITLAYYIKYGTQIKNKLVSMIYRCEITKNKAYKYYGSKGVSVCSEWRYDPEAFIYWCWENKYFLGCHIHRIDPDMDYEPKNCVLCTPEEHYAYHSKIAKDEKEKLADYYAGVTKYNANQKRNKQKIKKSYDLEMEKLSLIIGKRTNL